MHLIVCGATGFGCKYLNTTYSENGKYGDCKKYDSQSSDLLRHAAPEKKSVWQSLDVIQYGCSCAAETGHCFKESICDRGYIATQIKWQHAEK